MRGHDDVSLSISVQQEGRKKQKQAGPEAQKRRENCDKLQSGRKRRARMA